MTFYRKVEAKLLELVYTGVFEAGGTVFSRRLQRFD